MKGKQAAAAARRREKEAQEKVEELTERLREARKEADALRTELAEAHANAQALAGRIAAEEVTGLREQLAQAVARTNEVNEEADAVRRSKDDLVREACRYVSMTTGAPPLPALSAVIGWIDDPQALAGQDTRRILQTLMLPPTGFVAQQLNHSARGINFSAPGAPTACAAYQPGWYESRKQPRTATQAKLVTQ